MGEIETSRIILDYLQRHLEQIVDDVKHLVMKESPTHRKALVDECGNYARELFRKRLGLEAETISQREVGDFLKYTFGDGERQLLIVGHLDTVWEPGRLGYRTEGNRAYGPGIYDMKGGIVQALWALKSIKDSAIPLRNKIVFLLNTDEETGSEYSRALIEREAANSAAALIPEPSDARTGALKTARKGWGKFRLQVRGRASHAGSHHRDGVNALEELARQIVFLQELTDYRKGTTVNVGIAQGGTRFNVVPEYAEAEIDLRVESPEEAERVCGTILGLKPFLPGASLEVSGGIGRPPMVRTKRTAELFAIARTIASELGFELQEASVGGTSDGNFTAALGVPTLDGLGAVGDGAHAEHEHIVIDELARRAALFANLLIRI